MPLKNGISASVFVVRAGAAQRLRLAHKAVSVVQMGEGGNVLLRDKVTSEAVFFAFDNSLPKRFFCVFQSIQKSFIKAASVHKILCSGTGHLFSHK